MGFERIAEIIFASDLAAKFSPLRARTPATGGAFTFRVDQARWVYRYLEFYVGVRSRWLKLPYGDQAIFVKRNVF